MFVGTKKVPEDKLTEPYGEIIRNKPIHLDKPVCEWNRVLKMWEVTHVMEDPENIVADDLKTIPSGNCRKCHQLITPYLKKYFERHYENGFFYCFEYSQELGYCENCAKEKAQTAFINDCLPELERVSRTFRDGQTVETEYFSDGSIVEEMTVREIQAKKL